MDYTHSAEFRPEKDDIAPLGVAIPAFPKSNPVVLIHQNRLEKQVQSMSGKKWHH